MRKLRDWDSWLWARNVVMGHVWPNGVQTGNLGEGSARFGQMQKEMERRPGIGHVAVPPLSPFPWEPFYGQTWVPGPSLLHLQSLIKHAWTFLYFSYWLSFIPT